MSKHNGHSDPSAMSRIAQELIYKRRSMQERHWRPAAADAMRSTQVHEPAPTISPSRRPLEPAPADLCAIGYCPGCGRTLIDAVRESNGTPFRAWCSVDCQRGHATPCHICGTTLEDIESARIAVSFEAIAHLLDDDGMTWCGRRPGRRWLVNGWVL